MNYIGDDVNLIIYDEDVVGNDLVAQTNFKISALCVNGGIEEWFPV